VFVKFESSKRPKKRQYIYKYGNDTNNEFNQESKENNFVFKTKNVTKIIVRGHPRVNK
jgi:hypothetical protein